MTPIFAAQEHLHLALVGVPYVQQPRNRGAVATASTRGETSSDWYLLQRIAAKDEEALSALYDRYSGLVFSMAKRVLHRTGEAEEVLQDVFY